MRKLTKTKTILTALTVAMLSGSVLTACNGGTAKEPASTGKEVSSMAKEASSMTKETSSMGKASSSAGKENGSSGMIAEEKTDKVSESVDFGGFVDKVDELVKLNWPVMDKIWPEYNYNNHDFIIFRLDDEYNVKEARLLSVTENRKMEKSEYEGITPPNPQGYDQIKFNGRHSIVMSVEDSYMQDAGSVQELYRTATHEMVHFYYQKGVKANANSSRSQIYPIEKEPRILRRMLYTRLIQAFENPDKQDEYLGKAKFWLDKYNKEFKNEANSIRATDIAEGTARYTENISVFIGKNLSKEDFKKEAETFIPKDQIFIAADKESYEIGYVAGLIFDEINPNWKDNYYSTGKGIPEVLLEKVKPIKDEQDKELADEITKKIDSTNEDAKEKLKDVIKAGEDVNVPLLHLDVSKGSKSFYAENMFKYQNSSVMSGYSSKFNVDGKNVEIISTAIISGYEEEHQYLRVPLTMKYEIKDGILTIDSEHLKADGIKVEESKEDGRVVYSAAVQD